MFNVESGRESRASEIEQTQTPEPSEAEETGNALMILLICATH